MILRELLLKLGLDIDEASIAKGQLAAALLEKGLEKVVEIAQETVHKFVELIEKTAESGVEIMELSKATGIATDTIQDLQTAAAFTGVSMDTLKVGLFSLSKNMYSAAQGSEETQKAFTALGVKIKDPTGKLRGADDVLFDIADKFKDMPDGPKKLALSMEVLGKAGKGMVEMLSEGREGIEALATETPNLTAEQLKASKEIIKTQKQIALTTENLWQRAIGPLLPAINELLQRYLAWKKAGAELMRQRIEKYLGFVIKAIGKVATVAGWVVDAFDAVTNTIGIFIGVIWKAAQGLKYLYDQTMIFKIMLGYAGLLGALWLFASGAVQAGAKVMWAWIRAAAPFLAIGAVIAALILIMDDLNAYAEGRDSLFGRVVDGIDKWLRIKPEDSPFMRGIKGFLQMLRDAVEILVELDDVFGDGSKKRAMVDKMAARNKGQQQQATDQIQLETARTQARAGVPLSDASKDALKRAGVPEKAFIAQYKGQPQPGGATPELASGGPAPEYRAPAGAGAAGGMSSGPAGNFSPQTQITVVTQPGQSNEAIGQVVKDKLTTSWDDQLESTMAGTSY